MPITVKYCHPDDWTLVWTGLGKKPRWLEFALSNGITLDQCAKAVDVARQRSEEIRLANSETVTKKPPVALVEDQAQLPGLPPIPKKRGRPATGKAKTPAQRKRDSRSVMRDVICWGTVAESSTWIETASIAQLLEAYAVAAKQPNGGGHTCLEIAEVLQRRAQDMIG